MNGQINVYHGCALPAELRGQNTTTEYQSIVFGATAVFFSKSDMLQLADQLFIFMAKINNSILKEIRKMYCSDEMSAQEIADVLGIGIHAVYNFMRRQQIERRSFTESNAVRFEKAVPSFNVSPLQNQYLRDLKALGVMLYWAEGAKYDGATMVDFANSDPAMIVIFLKFLRFVCGVNEKKLRVYPYFYSNQNITENLRFWQSITNIPISQFTKTYIRTDYRIEKKSKMPFGMVHIRYSDKKLLLLIKEWIEEYKIEFTRAGTQVANGVRL